MKVTITQDQKNLVRKIMVNKKVQKVHQVKNNMRENLIMKIIMENKKIIMGNKNMIMDNRLLQKEDKKIRITKEVISKLLKDTIDIFIFINHYITQNRNHILVILSKIKSNDSRSKIILLLQYNKYLFFINIYFIINHV
jgi:hypothetical protein